MSEIRENEETGEKSYSEEEPDVETIEMKTGDETETEEIEEEEPEDIDTVEVDSDEVDSGEGKNEKDYLLKVIFASLFVALAALLMVVIYLVV